MNYSYCFARLLLELYHLTKSLSDVIMRAANVRYGVPGGCATRRPNQERLLRLPHATLRQGTPAAVVILYYLKHFEQVNAFVNM